MEPSHSRSDGGALSYASSGPTADRRCVAERPPVPPPPQSPHAERCPLLCIRCQIFAFLAFLIHLPLTFCRVVGLNHPLARDTQHSLYIELVLSCIEWFCFFLQVCIWGGACFSPSRNASGASVTGKGYGLMIASFFFLTINTVAYFLMRSNEGLVLGNGASRGGGGGGEYGGAGEGGEYNSDASQPTFSYQANPSDSGSTM